MSKNIIGDRLRELRGDMLQEDIAKASNINRPALSSYEQGKTIPSIDKLIILSKVYNTSLDYICGVTDVKTPTKYNLDDTLGLSEESYLKLQVLSKNKKKSHTLYGIDTIDLLLKYGSTEFFEFISEYLLVPYAGDNIEHKKSLEAFSTSPHEKKRLIAFRKQTAEEYIVLEEIKNVFNSIKKSKEVMKEYSNNTTSIERDRPSNRFTDKVNKNLDK